jgi:small-conductance mechanosensitive channel
MNVDRIVHSVAGTFILASLLLAHFVSPYWLWFTAFVGANLLQSGLTNWCLMSSILARLGVSTQGACGLKTRS